MIPIITEEETTIGQAKMLLLLRGSSRMWPRFEYPISNKDLTDRSLILHKVFKYSKLRVYFVDFSALLCSLNTLSEKELG